MKLLFCYFFILINTGSFINYQDIEIQNYKNALSLIFNSSEFRDYSLVNKNYYISSEIIFFSNIEIYFKDELKNNDENVILENEIVKINEDLVKLNKHRCGKIKIFFSEQKNDVFFAEVFIHKKKNINYKDRPIFGSSKLYMFKVINKEVSIVVTKDIHYN
ncbi:hypothetical protein [Flavobacterium sp.]|uniref:hypothetical protein n=1 Tax=Flavobacterium sp. TaxID=239 RepID=UPI0026354231|nr:hypothetical protein [Flavobacterium sp.]